MAPMSELAEARSGNMTVGPTLSEKTGVFAWPRLWLCVVIAAFVVISTAYNFVVPLYEAPDEYAHGLYVRTLAEEGKLPGFKRVEEYESWQPPLYYALGAGMLRLLALEPPVIAQRNPEFPAQSAHETIAADTDFPYKGPVLSVHLLRGLSTLFGAGTILFVYLTALCLFPGRRLLAWCAAAVAGLVPQFAFISASMSNDAAAGFFAAATAYCGIRYYTNAEFQWLLVSAAALSLGGLTKSTALVAGIIPFMAVAFSNLPLEHKVRHASVLTLFPLVFAGWFYARSVIIWGAIYPKELFEPGVNESRPIWDAVYRTIFVPSLRDSYWYWGGWFNVRMSQIVYDVLNLIAGLALAGVVVSFVKGKLSRSEGAGLLMLGSALALAFIGVIYVSWNISFQPQGRFLFVGQTAVAILLPFGLGALFSRNRLQDHPALVGLPLLLLAVNVYILAVVIPRAY